MQLLVVCSRCKHREVRHVRGGRLPRLLDRGDKFGGLVLVGRFIKDGEMECGARLELLGQSKSQAYGNSKMGSRRGAAHDSHQPVIRRWRGKTRSIQWRYLDR